MSEALEVIDPQPQAAISEREIKAVMKMATMLVRTNFVPKALRDQGPEAALACILAGRELGLGPMQALRTIDIVEGKPALSAALQGALIRRRGHHLTVRADATRAIAKGKRGDTGDEGEFAFTIDMARRAGLLSKAAWKNHPEQMLGHRALTSLARQLFQDVLVGFAYSPEEVEEIGRLEQQRPGAPAATDSSEAVAAASDPLDRLLTEAERNELKALFGKPLDESDLRKGWTEGTLDALKAAINLAEESEPAIKHASSLSTLTRRHYDAIKRLTAEPADVITGEVVDDDAALDAQPGSLL